MGPARLKAVAFAVAAWWRRESVCVCDCVVFGWESFGACHVVCVCMLLFHEKYSAFLFEVASRAGETVLFWNKTQDFHPEVSG